MLPLLLAAFGILATLGLVAAGGLFWGLAGAVFWVGGEPDAGWHALMGLSIGVAAFAAVTFLADLMMSARAGNRGRDARFDG